MDDSRPSGSKLSFKDRRLGRWLNDQNAKYTSKSTRVQIPRSLSGCGG